MQSYTPKQLQGVIEAGGLRNAMVVARGPLFFVHVTTRSGQGVLTKARSEDPRSFANPVQAFSALRKLGICFGGFDTNDWTPEQREPVKRPDVAETMKQTHAAAAHDRWFRARVDAALAKADSPATEWIQHEYALADMDAQRLHLMQRRKEKKV